VVWAVLLLSQGIKLSAKLLRPYSLTVGIVILLLFLFEKWIWRISIFEKILHHPRIYGTWKGELQSDWVNPETQMQIDPIAVYLTVRQTYSTVSLRLITAESVSQSLIADLEYSDHSVPTLSSTYHNVPFLAHRHRSQIHYGAMILEIHDLPVSKMTGFYWTDRRTTGELSLDQRQFKIFDSFKVAASNF
jgi:hypothetical protein